MVLEVTDISSGEELSTAPPPKQGNDVLTQSLVAPTSSLTATSAPPSPVDVESRDVPPEVCTSTSMRMYADELTAADVSNAEALLGFSPTNEHRDEPICGAYLDNSTISEVKQDVSSTSVPSTEEREAAADDNEEHEPVVIMADVEENKNEAAKDPTATYVMMKETAVVEEKTMEQETFATDLVEEEKEKPVEEVLSGQNVKGELVEAPAEEVAQEEAARVTELITEQVFLETRPDSIEASSSKTDLLDVMTEQIAAEPETAEVETSLIRKSKGKKKRANFIPKPILSRISLASSITIPGVVKSFTNTLSSLSKPSVPKASMRKMTKLPKIEKLPSVSKLSSSVVTGSSLISKRLSSVHVVSQRSLPRLPKKLRSKTSRKEFKTSEHTTTSPQEVEDIETETPKTSINSTWLETDSENKTLPETKIAEVEAPAAVTAVPDTDAVNDVSDTALEVSASVEEKPKQRNYFEELLDKFDSLCAPVCKSNINQAETMQSPNSTSELPDNNPRLEITTNATENSFLDGVKSLCSIATERTFFGEEKPAVQVVRAREEPDQLEIAAMMAKKALDENTGAADGNRGETNGVKSMFRIFSPTVSSMKVASDIKKVTGQSLRRITNRKHGGQVPSNEAVEPLVSIPPESQSLDEVQTIFLTNSCVASAGLNEKADKEDHTAEPAGESSPDDRGLLRLRQSRASKEGNPIQPKGRFSDAEALLGRSRSSL